MTDAERHAALTEEAREAREHAAKCQARAEKFLDAGDDEKADKAFRRARLHRQDARDAEAALEALETGF